MKCLKDSDSSAEQVAEAQRECQHKLGAIVRQQFAAEDLEAEVLHSVETLRCEVSMLETALADATKVAQDARDAAMPALSAATDALTDLNRPDFAELKSYACPPMIVELVLCAVLVLQGREPTWTEAKKMLGDANFVGSLIRYDKTSLTSGVLTRLYNFTSRPEFQPEAISASSQAAYSLSTWCIAMQVYGEVMQDLHGQDSEVQRAGRALHNVSKALDEAEQQVDDVRRTLEGLHDQYIECHGLKETLAAEATELDSHRPPPQLAVSSATACNTGCWLEDWVHRSANGHRAGGGGQSDDIEEM